MKFIHTADWQVGMKAAHVGDCGDRVREERLESARRVVSAAVDNAADFMLVAGDTFEDNGVDRVLVQKVADILGGFESMVYIIPGNHDPMVPGSVWEHPSWKTHENIFVASKAEPVELDGGVLFPCPALNRHSSADPTRWIDVSSTGGVRLGLAHGTVAGITADEPDYPVPADAAERLGLDYLALGHWHSYSAFKGAQGVARTAYSGTHEPTRFGERESGQALLVEVEGPGSAPVLTPLKTAGLNWVLLEKEITVEGDLARVRAEVEELNGPESTLVRVVLSGLVSLAESGELARLDEIIASRFLYGTVDSTGLRPQPGAERLLEVIPAGILGEAAALILEMTDPSCAGRPADVTPGTATQALLELYAAAVEVRR